MKPQEIEPVRYAFLDRDGVLNRKMPEGVYLTRWPEFEWLAGAEEAIARMNRAGVMVILATNQRGIALGALSAGDLELIHSQMERHLARRGAKIDAIFYCPHDLGQCNCRKPDTGLFERALQLFPEANSRNSVVIGDSISDIEAGKRLGMRTVFIFGEPGRQKAGGEKAAEAATATARSLLEAVENYLNLR